MRVLLWHVHGSWTTSFVQGRHEYVLPVLPDRGPDGRGRARTWDWPTSAREVAATALADEDLDVVLLQRPHEIDLVRAWTGRTPGRDLPAVYIEHDTPRGHVPCTQHVLADRSDIPVVHVTPFNELMWDNGVAPTVVIEHGIVDPGPIWSGSLPHAAVVTNDPVRRGRITGTDLIAPLSIAAPVDVFGMNVTGLCARYSLDPGRVAVHEDLPQHVMHLALAARRVYLHLTRWTSLGLSLLEAMALGMPVVALGATEAWEAVPPEAGCVSTSVPRLIAALRELVNDHDRARSIGKSGRAAVLARYSLPRFLDDWDRLLWEVTR